MKKWIELKDLDNYQEADIEEIRQAMDFAVSQVKRNLPDFTEKFPAANS